MVDQLNIRQLTEKREGELSRFAVQSRSSRGRQREEEPCPIRTAFQRDRDRIIHSKSFRRLKHKTQVFIAAPGDHYVTRLTHTLEVSQIARTIARALNLNEDLTEAIALGHDLGHTPFGHIGEQVLNELYSPGFSHSEQSCRVVELLENDGQGLNLTWEVRDGITHHSKPREDVLGEAGQASTLEGELCKVADAVAYINHDIGDAIRADVIKETDLPALATEVLGNSHRERINNMVSDIIEQSWSVLVGDSTSNPAINMSRKVLEATNIMREFLFNRVYKTQAVKEEANRAREIVRLLYSHYTEHEKEIPPEYSFHSDEIERKVVDYIASMTDQFAEKRAEELSII